MLQLFLSESGLIVMTKPIILFCSGAQSLLGCTFSCVLTSYRGIGPRLLLAPAWDKHCDGFVTSFVEEVYRKLDASAREHFLVAMTVKRK